MVCLFLGLTEVLQMSSFTCHLECILGKPKRVEMRMRDDCKSADVCVHVKKRRTLSTT